ncbi:hypothetical protein PMPD1_2944 [Paramixta manurensis]|uniref:DUF7480 domain-containing protein n=1 Tax=Paramixta manurensis TaxID=2740817 RepID=A0A6M8UDN4_9GAMM|nr:hypothetical protein PMPD1_2944 [Erwiniaceae bacterium PD-1]
MMMSKKFVVIALVFFLSGCPGPMDRLPVDKPANVIMRDNQLCITAPTRPGEYVSSVQISDGKDNNLRKTFNKDPIKVSNGQCLPTLNYDFKTNHNYVVYYNIEGNNFDKTKYFSVEFSIDRNGIHQTSPLSEK